jgi:hypothetical protein
LTSGLFVLRRSLRQEMPAAVIRWLKARAHRVLPAAGQ